MEWPVTEIPAPVLAAFGTSDGHVRLFDSGAMNRHWLVVPPGTAAPSVIGCYNPWRSRAAIEWEQALVNHVAGKGWPVPTPLPSRGGSTLFEHEGRLWAAASLLEGEFGTFDTAAEFHERGRLLAALHRDLEDFPSKGQRPDTGTVVNLDPNLAQGGLGTFDDVVALVADADAHLAEIIRAERGRNLRELSELGYSDLAVQPVHGDFGRYNLLWKDGRFSALLDFDQCRLDAPLSDLAQLLMPFMPLELELAAALLDGYQTILPLSPAEWKLIPALARSALLRWVAYLLGGWRPGVALPDGVARTMTVRLPAFYAAEPAYRALRRGAAD